MIQGKHERFLVANCELRGFLQMAEEHLHGAGIIQPEDLEKVQFRLSNIHPEIGDAARSEILDADLRKEFVEYVENLKALQTAIETIFR